MAARSKSFSRRFSIEMPLFQATHFLTTVTDNKYVRKAFKRVGRAWQCHDAFVTTETCQSRLKVVASFSRLKVVADGGNRTCDVARRT